jgi:hypothetical protein
MLLLPVVIFLGLYLPALDYDFIWTDHSEIEHEVLLRPAGEVLGAFAQPMDPDLAKLSPGTAQPYYRPLQVVVASVVHNNFGKRPRYFRAVSLALGSATIALFGLLVWLIVRDEGVAFLAAALLAAHPVLIEVYLWIAGLSAALAYFFLIICLILSVLALRAKDAARRYAMLAGSTLALALGLLSKESIAIVPGLTLALIITLDRLERTENPATPRRREFHSAALGLLIAHTLITCLFVFVWRPYVFGAVLTDSPPISPNPAVHLLTVMATWPSQLVWLFLPLTSTTSDVVRIVNNLIDPLAVLGAGLAVGSAGVWWWLLRQGHSVLALGLAWVALAFLPTSGIVPLTHARAVRYLAPSVFGATLIMALGLRALADVLARRWFRERAHVVLLVLAVVSLLGLASRSFVRIPDWRSDIALFGADVQRDPLYREGYSVLASALVDQERYAEAVDRLTELDALGDRFTGYSSFLRGADAFLLLCNLHLKLEQSEEALAMFDGQLRADSPELPKVPQSFLCGALALEQAGRSSQAMPILRAVQAQSPSDSPPQLLVALARCAARSGLDSEARVWLNRLPMGSEQIPSMAKQIEQVHQLLEQ